MSWQDIRPLAVGVAFRNDGDEILLSRLRDEQANETFYRPIGGGIEFGEPSEETLVREFREELAVEVVEHDLVETLENRFTFQGHEGHEIWFLYEVEFAEDWPCERDRFEIRETEHGHDETFPAVWVRIDRLSDVTVYPQNLAELV
jgi:8-oxo-dGTP pyrophosphatase MutT (NUDIX family)